MANRRYRDKITRSVQRALQEFEDSSSLNTPAMKGRVREIATEDIFEPLLFDQLKIGRGNITDYAGNESAEFDSIVYSTRRLAALMYEAKLGLYPADATLFAIEIKSTLTAAEVRDSLRKAETLGCLRYTTGTYEESNGRRTESWFPLYPVIFAFRSDLSEGGKTEIERYREVDALCDSHPRIKMICVIGRGFWWFNQTRNAPGQWFFHPPTDRHDEVIDFTAIMLRFSAELMNLRGQPKLSPYLVELHFDQEGSLTRRY